MPKSRSLFKNQDYYKLRQECLDKNELFYDELFHHDVPNAMWLRPSKIVKDPQFMVGGASRFDVIQGANSGCWLLVAMANLTMNATFFNHVVPKDQSFSENYAGIFRFNIWQCGKWVEVVIDDRLPTKDGVGGSRKLMFTHSKQNNEFWSALLEKAYAKLYGSYNELTAGWFNEAMVDFTGGIVERVDVNQCEPDDLEMIIKKSLAKSSFICVFMTDDPNVKEMILPNGLVKGHAYGLTRIITVIVNDRKVSILRLRNPWGKAEWLGAWSDRSKEWHSFPKEQKKKLGVVCENDGEFWMPLDEFIRNFEYMDICHLTPELFGNCDGHDKIGWEKHIFKGQWTKGVTAGGFSLKSFHLNPQYRVVLTDTDDDSDNLCSVLIGLMQRNKSREIWHKIGFTAFRLEGPEKDLKKPLREQFIRDQFDSSISCKFRRRRENVVRDAWEPGVYCIVPSTYLPEKEGQYLLRIFTEKKASAEEHDSTGHIGKISVDMDQDEPIQIETLQEDEPIRIETSQEDESFQIPGPIQDSPNLVDFQGPKKDSRAQQGSKLLQRNDQEILEYFQKIAGSDNEIGWEGLQSILEYAISKDGPSDAASLSFIEKVIRCISNLIYKPTDTKLFTKDECRSLISILDDDCSGRLSFKEFQILWKKLQHWESVFVSHSSFLRMDAADLSAALRELGWVAKPSELCRLVTKYGDSNGQLEFDDFVMCSIEKMTEL